MNQAKTKQDEGKARVAIVDDDPEVIAVVTRILTARGYEVMGMTEAIGSSRKLNSFQPHLIIMDVMMPAVNGDRLIDLFRATVRKMPRVIFFSGIAPRELEDLALQAGADDFVYKGDGFFRLLNRVNLHAFELGLM